MSYAGFLLRDAGAGERLQRNRMTHEAWGTGLTVGEYLERERRLRQTAHGRLAMRTWLLKVPNGVTLASCETFRLRLRPDATIEVIASVFVDRPLRGAGIASRLLRALVEDRREAGLDALVLFSEVGPTLYERLGFRRLPAPTRRLEAEPGAPPAGVRLLRAGELPAALALRQALRGGAPGLELDETIFGWHLERSRVYAEAQRRAGVESIGATDGKVLLLWSGDFKDKALRVLEASGPQGASLERVLDAATRVASDAGLLGVELWDDCHSLRLGGPEPAERLDDLPMGIAFTAAGAAALGPLSRAFWA